MNVLCVRDQAFGDNLSEIDTLGALSCCVVPCFLGMAWRHTGSVEDESDKSLPLEPPEPLSATQHAPPRLSIPTRSSRNTSPAQPVTQ